MTLKDTRVVVLGGTSGIGLAVAQAALEEGASVVVASRQAKDVTRAQQQLAQQSKSRSSALTVDVTSEDALKEFFAIIGPFDHLVYTAGDDLPIGPLVGIDLRHARARFEVRYWGAVAAVKYGIASMREGGSIVLTSGLWAIRPRTGWTSQASIQSAVEGLTRALAIELGPIRVNAVSPGLTRTPRWDSWKEADREAFYHGEERRLPVGRVGDATELAHAYIYLMRNTFATGSVVRVDGGGSIV